MDIAVDVINVFGAPHPFEQPDPLGVVGSGVSVVTRIVTSAAAASIGLRERAHRWSSRIPVNDNVQVVVQVQVRVEADAF
ncbi:MAG TPA: hypothetical protein VLB44_26015 [Kofleriaceae bacterium]|nr:hypothetical protein [Kofleriaceae bacterium]